MRGSNTLVANTSTVVQAMQEYLDRRTVGGKADKVDSVTFRSGSVASEYHFTLSERKVLTKEAGDQLCR
jgi:hypothetical protein